MGPTIPHVPRPHPYRAVALQLSRFCTNEHTLPVMSVTGGSDTPHRSSIFSTLTTIYQASFGYVINFVKGLAGLSALRSVEAGGPSTMPGSQWVFRKCL